MPSGWGSEVVGGGIHWIPGAWAGMQGPNPQAQHLPAVPTYRPSPLCLEGVGQLANPAAPSPPRRAGDGVSAKIEGAGQGHRAGGVPRCCAISGEGRERPQLDGLSWLREICNLYYLYPESPGLTKSICASKMLENSTPNCFTGIVSWEQDSRGFILAFSLICIRKSF